MKKNKEKTVLKHPMLIRETWLKMVGKLLSEWNEYDEDNNLSILNICIK